MGKINLKEGLKKRWYSSWKFILQKIEINETESKPKNTKQPKIQGG